MTVIPRHRTQKLHTVKLPPRRTAHETVRHGAGHRIKHNIQTGIPVYNDTALRNLRQIRQQLPCITDSVKNTIIPAIHSVRAHQVRITGQYIHHPNPDIKLRLGRLTAGHIQMQSLLLDLLKLLFKVTLQILQLLFTQLTVRCHIENSLLFFFFLTR